MLESTKDFVSNRDLHEYLDAIDTLILSFVKTDEYASLSYEEKCRIVDIAIESKIMINKLIAVSKENLRPSEPGHLP